MSQKYMQNSQVQAQGVMKMHSVSGMHVEVSGMQANVSKTSPRTNECAHTIMHTYRCLRIESRPLKNQSKDLWKCTQCQGFV